MVSMNRGSQKAGTPKPSHRKPSKRHPTNNRGKSAEPVSTNKVIILRIFLRGDSPCSICVWSVTCRWQNRTFTATRRSVSRQPNQEHIQSWETSTSYQGMGSWGAVIQERKLGRVQSINLSRENIWKLAKCARCCLTYKSLARISGDPERGYRMILKLLHTQILENFNWLPNWTNSVSVKPMLPNHAETVKTTAEHFSNRTTLIPVIWYHGQP